MSNNSSDNRKIVNNTILLYLRMILIILINLYMSRVILTTMGVSDFGIYVAIGGIVAMFSIISGSLSTAISRFITFELGKQDAIQLRRVFSTSVIVQILISAVVICIGETVGIWFLNYKMNIPADRIIAANWVLQCSIFTFVVNLINIPYNALIIAHEHMSAYAYVSIADVFFKLVVVLLIPYLPFDMLKSYALLLLIASITIRFCYTIYCRRKFQECRGQIIFDKTLVKEMGSFAGWNLIGNGAYLLNTQGVNLLSNIFFGVIVNASRGIALQVEHAISMFVNNFTMAINPQITKSYANNNLERMYDLICFGSKYSFFLTLLITYPFLLETNWILKTWLNVVPDYAPTFVRLTVIALLTTVLSNTLVTAMFATGKIKKYQIIVGLTGSLVFPLTWLFFSFGYPAYTAYIIYALVYFALLFVRLYLMREMIKLSISRFVKNVILRTIFVFILASILPLITTLSMQESIYRFIAVSLVSALSSVLSISIIGLEKQEKKFIFDKINSFIKNKFSLLK